MDSFGSLTGGHFAPKRWGHIRRNVHSTDRIIKSQNDVRIVYINNEHNIGIALSLNKGILLAKGEYIARMDADDVMHQERIELQVDFLTTNKDHGLVGSSYNLINSDSMPLQRVTTRKTNKEICLNMLFYNAIAHPSVMIRADLAKLYPYNIEFPRCEDYDLWIRLSKNVKLYNLPKALINYRVHKSATSALHQKEMKQNVMELLSNHLEELGIEHSVEELMLHCAIGFGLGRSYFYTPDRIENLHQWLKKVFESPQIKGAYPQYQLNKFRKHLLEDCCRV